MELLAQRVCARDIALQQVSTASRGRAAPHDVGLPAETRKGARFESQILMWVASGGCLVVILGEVCVCVCVFVCVYVCVCV